MAYIRVFYKHQILYFLKLSFIFVVPYLLFSLYSDYSLYYAEYVLISVLIASQYIFSSEKQFKKSIEKKVRETLRLENKQMPSLKVVNKRLDMIYTTRIITALFIATLIGVVAFLWGK